MQKPLRKLTTSTSVDLIPKSTEFFITNATLNPRLTWTNDTTNPSHRWNAQKGVADPPFTVAGAPGGASLTPAASPAPTAAASTAATSGTGPSKDSGPEDYYQARAIGSEPAVDIPIPDGTSFIVINGTVGPQRTALRTEITPAPPNWDNSTARSANASNVWSADTVLYIQELDPNVRYIVKLQAYDLGSMTPTIGLHSITYYSGLDLA